MNLLLGTCVAPYKVAVYTRYALGIDYFFCWRSRRNGEGLGLNQSQDGKRSGQKSPVPIIQTVSRGLQSGAGVGVRVGEWGCVSQLNWHLV